MVGTVVVKTSNATHVQITIPPQGMGKERGMIPGSKDAAKWISMQAREIVPPQTDQALDVIQDYRVLLSGGTLEKCGLHGSQAGEQNIDGALGENVVISVLNNDFLVDLGCDGSGGPAKLALGVDEVGKEGISDVEDAGRGEFVTDLGISSLAVGGIESPVDTLGQFLEAALGIDLVWFEFIDLCYC